MTENLSYLKKWRKINEEAQKFFSRNNRYNLINNSDAVFGTSWKHR